MNKNIPYFTNKQENEIVELYTKQLWTTRKIAKKFKCVHTTILKCLKRHDIERRDQLNCRISAGYDRSYFESINTQEKAYFLGLLYADGCNSGKVFTIGLQEEDGYLLYYLRKALHANKIKIHKRKGDKKHHKNKVIFAIGSVKMGNDLIKLGCVPRKSLILQFPTPEQVPNRLIHHFIRGYFDGDGCVSISKKKAGGKYKTERFEGLINVTSSLIFCSKLKERMFELGIRFSDNRRFKDVDCMTLVSSGTFNIIKFYNYIYKDASIWMKRKKKKFEKLFKMKKYNLDGSKRKTGDSKYRGVHIKTSICNNIKYKYIRAEVRLNKHVYRLGTFQTQLEAAKAYDKKAFELFNKKAILNFPEDYQTTITINNKSEKTI